MNFHDTSTSEEHCYVRPAPATSQADMRILIVESLAGTRTRYWDLMTNTSATTSIEDSRLAFPMVDPSSW